MLPATPISSATVSTSRALRLLYLHVGEEGGRRCGDQSQGLTRARAMGAQEEVHTVPPTQHGSAHQSANGEEGDGQPKL
jgi:hypothetical protein